ncbi:MAG: hypothetical protein Q8P49_01995 [Candidatus Liptonbacteria bacterium]|nr:hypothetical protein [Candidatus Liptonbacteria bacterium]
MENIKKNFSLYIGLAIPVAMILVVAIVVYAPRVLYTVPSPQYDFLYAVGDNVVFTAYGRDVYPYPAYKGVWPKYVYTVENGKLKRTEAEIPPSQEGVVILLEDIQPKFYIHDTATNKSTQVSFEDAQALTLDTGVRSPDGFEVARGTGGGEVFPFFSGGGSNYNKRYIRKDYYAEELNLNLPSEYYAEFFLAWVIPQ